jgi:hypothetical protein
LSAEDALARAEQLLERIEAARTRLEQTEDSDEAIAILSELAELSKEVESELTRARRQAEADANS